MSRTPRDSFILPRNARLNKKMPELGTFRFRLLLYMAIVSLTNFNLFTTYKDLLKKILRTPQVLILLHILIFLKCFTLISYYTLPAHKLLSTLGYHHSARVLLPSKKFTIRRSIVSPIYNM